MGVVLKGEAELREWLRSLPEEVAKKAAQDGLRKASGRLRTLIRRAAPMKTGTLRSAIRSSNSKRDTKAWVGVKAPKGTRNAPNYYATLEKGRKAHMRGGKPVKASPQMARFAFFKKTWQTHQNTIGQIQIDATRAAIAKRAIEAARKAGVRGIRAR